MQRMKLVLTYALFWNTLGPHNCAVCAQLADRHIRYSQKTNEISRPEH